LISRTHDLSSVSNSQARSLLLYVTMFAYVAFFAFLGGIESDTSFHRLKICIIFGWFLFPTPTELNKNTFTIVVKPQTVLPCLEVLGCNNEGACGNFSKVMRLNGKTQKVIVHFPAAPWDV